MPNRGWKIKGYRPEASSVIVELRGRRNDPVKKGNTLDAEMRLCARYVTQPETSLRVLAATHHIRLGNVKEILRGWGIDLKSRNLIPWPPLQEGVDV
jgi:hypothetical protein